MKMHRYDEAEVIILKSLNDSKKLYTTKHRPYTQVLESLASYYHDNGRFSEAEKTYKEAIDITMKAGEKGNMNYLVQINNLAYLYADSGQLNDAVIIFRESLELRKIVYGKTTLRVATSQANLARTLTKLGEFDEAKTLLELAMPVYDSKNKSNLYNEITLTAIEIGEQSNKNACKTGLIMIETLMSRVNKVSEKSWRRMHAEIWLGELAYKCQANDIGKQLLNAAKEKSKAIYADNSDGQKMVKNKVELLLRNVE